MAKKRFNPKSKTESRIREENNWDKIFLLHIKKSLYVIILWAASMLIHSMVLKFTGIDEGFFTTIALYIIPLYLLVAIIYTISKHKRLDKKR